MYLVSVYIEYINMSLDNKYTYYTFDSNIKVGKRVLVNFNNADIIGFVININYTNQTLEEINKENKYQIKPIIDIIDQEVILNDELLELAKFMSKETISPLISCLNTILPPQLKPKKTKNKIITTKWVRRLKINDDLTTKQKQALASLNVPIVYSEFRKEFTSVVKYLKDNNYIEIFEKIKEVQENNVSEYQEVKLNNEQEYALKALLSNKKPALLYGVTGCGKTEVYLHLAKEYLKQNKQVLILVPEISLTPQMLNRVKGRFHDAVGIYHSGLNNTEKYHYYQKVKNNELSIIVGTRSSVFLPFSNLGLIIMDEEHDSSYKQDKTPTYHVRDIVLKRAEYYNAKVVLGSATPQLETYARSIKGIYDLVKIKKRVHEYVPIVNVIDLNKIDLINDDYIITNELKNAIEVQLNDLKQVIILVNRRGYHPLLKCSDCSKTKTCINCDVALNYHKDDKSLKCHMCGYIHKGPLVCECGSKNFSSFGYGIQKVEERLKYLFKNATIARMDADTTRLKNSHEKILTAFANKEIDILLGTQMVAKGLDFCDVTLVAILNADYGLSRIDYRSIETTFNLIMQASGRSGRHKKGEVYLQVYEKNHYVIKAVIKQDYDYFFNIEMNNRHKLLNPPYSYIIAIYISSINIDKCLNAINYLKDKLNQASINYLEPNELTRINNLNRYRIILKTKNLEALKNNVYNIVKEFYAFGHNVNIKIDVNPFYLG